MEFARIVKKNANSQPEHLVRRQVLSDISSALNPGGGGQTSAEEDSTTTAAPTTTTTSATTTTTAAEESSTSAAASSAASSEAEAESSSASSASSESSASSRERTSTSATPSETTVTSVITPTTVIVVGTSSITSTLPPVTSSGVQTVSSGSNSSGQAGSPSGLSTGAKVGIAVGSAVGGVILLALLAFLCLGARRRRRDKQNAADNILWPAVGDSSTLYPEQVHNTGGAGFGVGDDDDIEGPPMSEAGMMGAGAAGVGAAGLGAAAAGGAGRYGNSNSSGRQPTLPQVPPSIYSSEQGGGGPTSGYPMSYGSEGGHLAPSIPDTNSSPYNNGYSAQGSAHSHAPLMAGVGAGALAGAGGLAYNHSQSRHSPSPPRDYSTAGHSSEEGTNGQGHLPFPGEPEDFSAVAAGQRPVSPTPMQVGDTFGSGYDETDGGKRWRLSVVNDDPRDRD